MIIDSPIISGSYLSTGSLSQTGNVSITGSLTATGGISGSFSGSGADLFGIPASGITGLNLSQISSGSVSASISPNQGLLINTSVSASNFTGSFTGSLTGIATSASYASFALTSSYSLGGSGFPFSGSAVITGSLLVSGSAQITGSLSVSGSISASLFGTASQATSASYALTASYLLGYISPFPFTGSAAITGSLIVTGSVAISTLVTSSGVRYVIADQNGLLSAQTASAAIFTTQQVTSTAGQTTFPITNGYATGYVTVFVNGTKLSADEYVDTSGTNIVFLTGSNAGDNVEFQKYLPAAGVSNNTLRSTNYFTATTGQTNFSVNYTPGLIDIFYNGAKLDNTEYTAANGTSITLATASAAGDRLEVDVYSYQVGAFSGIGGTGAANQLAYFNTSNSITGSNAFTVSGSAIIVTGSLIVSGSGTLINIGPAVFSGSVTSTAGFSGSFSGNADSASLAQNSLLLGGTGSIGFATTASLLAVSSSQQQISASLLNVVANYATTGSNSFRANQSITGSLVVSSTITAQTLVVQTVTSSIVYSSGSNLFGNSLSNTQTFTGSVNITGSTNVVGTLNGTIANFIGAITSDMTDGGVIFTKTAGASVGLFTNTFQISGSGSKLDLNAYVYGANSFGVWTNGTKQFTIASTGAATFSSNITNVSALYVRASGNSDLPFINFSNADGVYNWGRIGGLLQGDGDGSLYFQTKQGGSLGTRLTITSTGAAAFTNTLTAAGVINGSVGVNVGANALGADRMFQISGTSFTTGTTQFAAVVNPSFSGTVTNVFGVYAGNNFSTGTITNSYNLYIEGTSAGSATVANKWGIYQSGGSDKNYFAGYVGVGASTTPVYMLEVSSTGGSQRIRVGTLQNNDNTPRFEAITSNGNSTANSAWLKVNDGSGFTLGQSSYTKAGGDSGNFANLSSEVESPAIVVQGNGDVLIGSGTTAEGPLDVYRSNSAGLGGHILLRNNGAAVGNETAVLFVDGGVGSTRAAISCTTEGAPYLGDIKFKTGASAYASLTTRMMITGGGNVLIGGTTDYGMKVVVRVSGNTGESNAHLALSHPDFGAFHFMDATAYWIGQNSAYKQLRMYSGGSIYTGVYLSAGGSSWTGYSDERIKDIIEPITNATHKLSSLRTIIGKYKTDADDTRRLFLIAQDVEKVFPEAVNKSNDEIGTMGIQYTDLIPVLVKAIQEQNVLIQELQEKLQRNNIN